MIDWNKLKPYKTSKERSFEQLCLQIGFRHYGQHGVFTPVDDSGGGDGIEFYLTLALGEQWGWQTKYYEGSARLRESNRKSAIKGSLKKTLLVHPSLTRWFLCLPLDPTVDETNWISTELPKVIPAGRTVEIVLWTHSSIHIDLNLPGFAGIRQAFFGSLELNTDWFARTFRNLFSLVKSKFDPLLYIPNGQFDYYHVNPALCNGLFRERLNFYLPLIKNLHAESLVKFDELRFTTESFRPYFNAYRQEMLLFDRAFLALLPQLEARFALVYPNSIDKLSAVDWQEEVELLNSTLKEATESFRIALRDNFDEQEEQQKSLNIRQHQKIWDHERKCAKLIEEIKYFIRDTCIPHKRRINHFLGEGGTGKTNASVAIVQGYIEAGLPAIFLPAIKFNLATPLKDQILTSLDIKSGYTFAEFLDSLNVLGIVYNIKVPFIIDGLNEAVGQTGSLNPVLTMDLPALEEEILSRSNLILITTCRTTYQEFFWPDTRRREDKRFHPLYGFTDYDDTISLVRHYFNEYRIQADYSFHTLREFSKPIYVKLYCETVNPERKNLKQVTLGYHSIYTIFGEYTQIADKHIFKRLTDFGRPPIKKNKSLASDVTAVLAGKLWDDPRRRLDIEEVITVADPDGISDFHQSATKAVLDEELLFVRDYSGENEGIYLTYDLMAGYFIAKHLITNYPDIELFLTGADIKKLTSHKYRTLHPVYDDVLTALCTLLPISKGQFVHEILPVPQSGDQEGTHLYNRSIKATLTIPPEYLPERQVNFIRDLTGLKGNLNTILQHCEPVLFVVDHPFNFYFFEEFLESQVMAQRDITWTEYLRNQDSTFRLELITEFKRLQQLDNHSADQQQKIQLVAQYLFWNFTSTDKLLKQEASDALFKYGKKYPASFFRLYEKSVRLNDPGVFEWMSMIGYNLVLCIDRFDKNARPVLEQVRDFLITNLFDPVGKYSTNHKATRDYAFRTLEIILNDVKAANIFKQKFSELGIQNWKAAADKNEKEYRDDNSLIHHRFEKERMYRVGGGGSEYNHTPLYDERLGYLRWRAYELGYDFSLFGEIDKTIARMQGYGDSLADTRRYADKYIDIAYQELLGYLEDRMLIINPREDGAVRIEPPAFEPKPENQIRASERLVAEDFINEKVSLDYWCNDHSIPGIAPFLHRQEFKTVKGNWQLLYGFFHQCKPERERQFFCYMEAILLRKKDYTRALKDFPRATNLGSNNTPYSTNVHDGEIPDGRIIPLNTFEEWYYTMDNDKKGRHLHGDGKSINIMHAVRFINKIIYPSKNIIDHSAISRTGEAKDLYDQAGVIASLSHRYDRSYVDQENFVYLQKKLLDEYLTGNELEMLYIVWGERDWYPSDGDWMRAGRKAKERKWAKFFEIVPYKRN